MPRELHFFDTSLLRPTLHGTSAYKKYVEENIPKDDRYINSYVRMEYTRGVLIALIDFYAYTCFPHVTTIADAIKLWAELFQGRGIKTIMALLNEMFEGAKIDLNDESSMTQARVSLTSFIDRLSVKLDLEWKDSGREDTSCARAKVDLEFRNGNPEPRFRRFLEKFEDTEACRKQCHLTNFLAKHKDEISKFMQNIGVSRKNLQRAKFSALEETLEIEPEKLSCKDCAVLGDFIIALQCPDNMTLEHVDDSFKGLCPLFQKKNTPRPSQRRFHKDLVTKVGWPEAQPPS